MDAGQLKHAVRSGAQTASIAQVASQLVSVAVLAGLFRLLAPDDFGLIGMVLPVLLLLRNLSLMGLNVVTIQRRDFAPAELSSLFWLNLLWGSVAAAATAVTAPWLVLFYGGRAELFGLTLALAGTTLVAAAGAQHQALLERRMRWVPLAGVRLLAQTVAGMAAIAAALAGWGVWSLVVQQYTELFVLAVSFWRVEPWRPMSPRRGAPVADLLALGGFFSAANLMTFLTTHVDKVLVGLVLGPRALGLYHQAFNLMMKPGYLLTTPLAGIMLPALARSHHDRAAYRELVTAFCRLIAIALFPAAAGLFVVAPDVMSVLGGPTWSAAGPILSALAPALLVQGFVNVAACVFASAGRTGRLLAGSGLLAVAMSAVVAAAVWCGRAWQLTDEDAIVWVGRAYAWGLIAWSVPYLAYTMRSVGLPVWTWIVAAARPASAALVMGGVVWVSRQGLITWGVIPPVVTLALLVIEGAAIYAALARSEIGWLLRQVGRLRRGSAE